MTTFNISQNKKRRLEGRMEKSVPTEEPPKKNQTTRPEKLLNTFSDEIIVNEYNGRRQLKEKKWSELKRKFRAE